MSVAEFNPVEQSNLYPNPANTYFSIQSKDPVKGIKVYNMMGKEILSFPYQEIYSIEGLRGGIYLVQLEHQQHIEFQTLIVE